METDIAAGGAGESPAHRPERCAKPRAAPRTRPAAPETEAEHLQALAADISARLRRVCSNLPDDEFAALVLEIARVRVRYEERLFGRHTRHG